MSLSESTSNPLPRPRRVLIVGAGPSGLVTLRNFLQRGQFDHVELVERRDDIGGVWYLDPPGTSQGRDNRPHWPSPSYPGLVGNVLPEFLSFSGFPFPPRATPNQPFPTLVETHRYLRAFAEPLLAQGKIRLNTEVVRVEELEGGGGWRVVTRDWSGEGGGRESEAVWDAVALAVAWYDTAVFPDDEGFEEAHASGLVTHAKWYRGPEGYEGKRVFVVGNANSSNDMATQLASIVQKPVFRSIRHPPILRFPAIPDSRIHDVAPVARYAVHSAGTKVDVHLTDGTVIPNLDGIFVGTGYRNVPAFVHVLDRSPGGQGRRKPLGALAVHPHRVPSLHRHILYAYNPTLAFIGALVSYTPFTMSDMSSTWVLLAWSGQIAYPATAEERLVDEQLRLETLRKLREESDNPPSRLSYHILGPDEKSYARRLRNDIIKARPEFDSVLPTWTDEDWSRREGMYQVKYDSLLFEREMEAVLGRAVEGKL